MKHIQKNVRENSKGCINESNVFQLLHTEILKLQMSQQHHQSLVEILKLLNFKDNISLCVEICLFI